MSATSLMRRRSDLMTENASLRAELETARAQVRALLCEASTDELTGLLNRRGFQRCAVEALVAARCAGQPLALVYADVDGLKQLNDSRGHEAGDGLIRAAARLLQASFREGDVVARLGGDEFAVLARGFHGDGAEVRRRIERTRRALCASGTLAGPLSISVGVVEVTADSTATLEDWLVRADSAMYAVKRGRRALGAPRGEALAWLAETGTPAGAWCSSVA